MTSATWPRSTDPIGREHVRAALDLLDGTTNGILQGPVACVPGQGTLHAWLDALDLEGGNDPHDVISATLKHVRGANVHTTHRRYFGLFNPAPIIWGEVADMIAARVNPQLAVWSHAPAAVEVEEHTLRFIARHLGIAPAMGCFTSGGEEANRCAVHVGLARAFPRYAEDGIRSLERQPVLYASELSHLAWLKIAPMLGIGRAAVRLVPVDAELRLDVHALQAQIRQDRTAGLQPFFVCATAGTTSAGTIDPLTEIAHIAASEGLHFHVDAAWAGAVALCRPWKHLLTGIARADSVTVDAHKWLSQPMGIGMFLTPHPAALQHAFGVSASYMPGSIADTRDYYRSSPMWSRRWVGLRLFLSLAVGGRVTFEAQIARDIELGHHLRARLAQSGWEVVNRTELPIVCFTDATRARDAAWHESVAEHVVQSGDAWISTVRLRSQSALRACITNWQSGLDDVTHLVDSLERARATRA